MFQTDVFNVLFEAILEGVIIVDSDQKIVATNAAACQMFGYEARELLNKHLNLLVPKESHSIHSLESEKFIKNKENRPMGTGRNLRGLHKSGNVFPIEIGLNCFNILDNEYVMAMIIDNSFRKEQEEKLENLNKQLEVKVDIKTKELKQVISELKKKNQEIATENKKRIKAESKLKEALNKEKELNELKTKFLSLVSHEFRTPLSGILTSAMLIEKYKLSEQQENRDKHIKIITEKVHFLNNILDDFFSLENIESGRIRYHIESIKLTKLFDEVIYNSNMLLKEGQHINYPKHIDDLSLYQDEKIVEIILFNVIHNAIKYSPENTTIDIVVKQDNYHTKFIIKDQGIGIPLKDQEKIFERYFRARNVLNTQGTGIGLNIVKSYLDNLGGNISFKSDEDKGATFTLTFPNKPIK